MNAILEILKRVGNIADTADSSSWPSKVWNIIVSIVAACALVVALACKVGIAVPGIPCAELGEIVENATDAGELPVTAPAE